jgi:Kef-type K+ transport system membrane component KefB
MKALDWLKFAGVYSAVAIASAVVAGLFGRETLGAPLRTAFYLLNGAFCATWFAAAQSGRAHPLSWRLALQLAAALAAIGVSAVVLVEGTVGFRSGMRDALEFTVPLSLLYPPIFMWASRRWARAAARTSGTAPVSG